MKNKGKKIRWRIRESLKELGGDANIYALIQHYNEHSKYGISIYRIQGHIRQMEDVSREGYRVELVGGVR